MPKKEYGYEEMEDRAVISAKPRPLEELPTVEELLDDRTELSKDFYEFKIGRYTLKGKFRRLTRSQCDDCEMEAERYWWSRLQENRGPHDPPLPYDHMNSLHIQTRIALEKEGRILYASLSKEDGSPLVSNYDAFKAALLPQQQEELYNRWALWQVQQTDWETMIEEEAKIVIDAFKKKDLSTIIAFDMTTLQACLSFLASQPLEFLKNNSSDSTSSEEQ